jgi:hypothetical protein
MIIFKTSHAPNPIPLFTFIKAILTCELKYRIKGRKTKKNKPRYHIILNDLKVDGRKVRTLLIWITDIIRKEKEKTRPYNKNSSML